MSIVSTLRAEKRSYGEWDDYWYRPLAGSAAAGIEVTEDNALGVTAMWSGVSQIAGTLGSLPLRLYRNKVGGGKEPARKHPLFPILERRPNRWMRRNDWLEMQQGHLLTRGNAFTQKLRTVGGKLLELIPLHPARMDVRIVANNELRYLYRRPGGGTTDFPADEILHVRGLSSNGIVGYSPVTLMREAIGMSLATERHGARLFANDARPGGILTHPNKLTPEAKKNLKLSWHEAHSGENVNTVAVLEEGLKWEAVGFSAEDSQFLGSRQFQVVEIARILNISPNRLQDHSRSTFSNVEHLDIEFVKHTMRPWIVRWEEALEESLLTEAEREEYSIRFTVEALLRGDMASQSAWFREMWGIGAYSINDILELQDRNPVEGGDQRFVPLNMVPLDAVGELFTAPAASPAAAGEETGRGVPVPVQRQILAQRSVAGRVRLRDAHRRVMRAEADRLLAREINAARRALKRDPTVAGFTSWLKEFYGEYAPVVAKAFLPVLSSYAEVLHGSVMDEVGGDEEISPELERLVRDYDATLGVRWQLGSLRQLDKLARDAGADVLEETIGGRLDEWEEKRADKIADKESVRAGGAFVRAIYTGLGLAAIWVASSKACPICKEMDGRRVGAGEDFLPTGATLDISGSAPLTTSGSIAHPPLHGGCTCTVRAGI